MNAVLQRLLDAHDGVVARSVACHAVSEDVVGWAARSGQLVLPYPRVLVDPRTGRRQVPHIAQRSRA